MTDTQDKIRRELEASTQAFDQAQAEREARAQAVHHSRRSQQIEGGDISPVAQALSEEYVEGKLTTAQMREKLLAHYGVTIK